MPVNEVPLKKKRLTWEAMTHSSPHTASTQKVDP